MLRKTAIGSAAVIVVVSAAALAYRASYGTLNPWGLPDHISWCGRDYNHEGPDLSQAEIGARRTALPGEQPYQVTTVTRLPPLIGRPVLAAVTPQADRERLGVPCTMSLYLKVGDDTYAQYTISGGP